MSKYEDELDLAFEPIPPTHAVADAETRNVLDALARNIQVAIDTFVPKSNVDAIAQQAAKEVTGKPFDINAMKDVLKRIAQDVDIKGVDDNTGYGIPTIPDNFRAVIKQVAIDRGLMKDTATAPAPAPQRRTK